MTLALQLQRCDVNPLLAPTGHAWENAAVCNPAALLHDGEVHLFYRAIDREGISSVGHAVSKDGLTSWRRGETPVLAKDPKSPYQTLGVEDPRITWLEGKAYITCTLASVYPDRAPRPWDAGTPWRVRVGMASSEDLQNFSPPEVVIPRRDSKNAVLFPEKLGGKWVMLHRQYPDIWIAYSDDGRRWAGHKRVMRPRKDSWDSERVGAGPPPILTEYGWLLMYHATEILPGSPRIRRYRVGLALFDREDPSRLLARSPEPIFEPGAEYEAPFRVGDWEIQVVFPTGWVELDGRVLVYYGAGDTRIGAASVGKEDLLRYAAFLREGGKGR